MATTLEQLHNSMRADYAIHGLSWPNGASHNLQITWPANTNPSDRGLGQARLRQLLNSAGEIEGAECYVDEDDPINPKVRYRRVNVPPGHQSQAASNLRPNTTSSNS
jgi:hypothetical protein